MNSKISRAKQYKCNRQPDGSWLVVNMEYGGKPTLVPAVGKCTCADKRHFQYQCRHELVVDGLKFRRDWYTSKQWFRRLKPLLRKRNPNAHAFSMLPELNDLESCVIGNQFDDTDNHNTATMDIADRVGNSNSEHNCVMYPGGVVNKDCPGNDCDGNDGDDDNKFPLDMSHLQSLTYFSPLENLTMT